MRKYLVADLFCGAGGSSTGALRAIREIGGELELVAVNHWPIAIDTHTKNHPHARHYIQDVTTAKPEALVPEGYLDLLMASPECIFHSNARGGRPINDQRRMDPWAVQNWITRLDVACVLIENVPEFVKWGPLLANGRPDPAGRGRFFEAWIQAFWGLGYTVDWKMLNAANFGDATTRTRFFLQARKDGEPIRWPEPSHSRSGGKTMLGRLPRWRAAREIIDWANAGRSLLDDPKYKKRPLSEKTRRRIARGLERFGGPLAPLYIALLDLDGSDFAASHEGPKQEPFVGANRNNNVPHSVDEPIPGLTTAPGGGDYIVNPTAEPFVSCDRNHVAPRSMRVPVPTITTLTGGGISVVLPEVHPFILGQQSGAAPRDTSAPIPTVAADGAISVVQPTAEPFILGQNSAGRPRSIDEPAPTVVAIARIAVVEPFLTKYYKTGIAKSVDVPLDTISTKDRFGLAQPSVVPYGPRAEARDVDEPVPTILTKDRLGLAVPTVDPFIVPNFGERDGQAARTHDVDDPVPTVTSRGAGRLVEPVLIEVNHGDDSRTGERIRSVDEPLGTVTTKRGTGLAQPVLVQIEAGQLDPRRLVLIDDVLCLLDIRFRMLTNRELARAMGFDDDEASYEFSGNISEVTRQIGNAVPVRTAAALVRAILEPASAAGEAVA